MSCSIFKSDVYPANCKTSNSSWCDFLTCTEENQGPQVWTAIDEKKRPKEYICIVDLGGHFISACPLTVEVSHENSQTIPVKGNIFGNSMRGVNALPSFTNAGDRWIEQRPSFFS